jgi:CubicO group peptidase (beta-lactamase class C family)
MKSARAAWFLLIAACASSPATPSASSPPSPPHASDVSASFGESTPEAVGLDSRALARLTEWVRDTKDVPIFSILISRDGKLAYELYTSHLARDDAHYLMSATKSVTSMLVGIAVDAKILGGPETSMSEELPAALFPSDADHGRFRRVTMKDVLGMSALDAQVPPHEISRDAAARQRAFLASDNRARFALTQPLLPEPGVSFQYTDITPYLAAAAVSYAANTTLFDFAEARLFGPLGFRNEEWMHEDDAGIDNGAYGLRARPIDMQKLGVLLLDGGTWNGRQILSEAWIAQSFSPWIRSKPEFREPNYGWYFWTNHFGPWTARVANGWKGQRIAIVPSERLVVTMTGAIEHGQNEEAVFRSIMERFVLPAVKPSPLPPDAEAEAHGRALLDEVRTANRVAPDIEARMVPSAERKERHHPLKPL